MVVRLPKLLPGLAIVVVQEVIPLYRWIERNLPLLVILTMWALKAPSPGRTNPTVAVHNLMCYLMLRIPRLEFRLRRIG